MADNLPIWRQFLRYSVSGMLATGVDKLLFYLMHYKMEVNVYVATTVAFLTGLAITYIFSITWIFQQRRMAGRAAEPLIYLCIGTGGVLLMNALMWVFMRIVPDVETVMLMPRNFFCNMSATVLVTVYNFIAKRFILFNKESTN